MPTMISRGKELIRICPANPNRLEYSPNQGRTWRLRYPGRGVLGQFLDLMDGGKELLATTTKGLCYSIDDGHNWRLRKHNRLA